MVAVNIPAWKKALFSIVIVSLSLLVLEGAARLAALDEPQEADGFPTAAPAWRSTWAG